MLENRLQKRLPEETRKFDRNKHIILQQILNKSFKRNQTCFICWSVPTHAQPIEPKPDITGPQSQKSFLDLFFDKKS